uniref:Protein kinase domain-containing protein n=1 Tax=Oryza nivara TaxID=4536 RepID=A0A0E0HYS3_ORYNI
MALRAVAVSGALLLLVVTRCGDVDIPYPFGIGPNCSHGVGFEIECNTRNGSSDLVPTLAATSLSIMQNLSVESPPMAKVMLPVAYQCYDDPTKTQDFNGEVELNKTGVYGISDELNMLVVLGCNTMVYTKNGNSEGGLYPYLYYTGCIAYCNDSRSAQDGKCAGAGCCHVDIPSGLTDNTLVFDSWNRTNPCDYAFLVAKEEYVFQRSDLNKDLNRNMPVWLDWAIRDDDSACPPLALGKKPPAGSYACVSDNSECVFSTNGPGYQSNDAKTQQCTPKFPVASRIALGVCLGFSFLIVTFLITLVMFQKQKMNEYFKKNGGSILQKVDNVKIFSKDELKKITKNNLEVLGQGGFGKVYKGTLGDNTIVAVKTSIEVNEARKDAFTNEVDVPMLVYEFAANGNLQDILHGDGNIPLPLHLRLDIAIESAEGLRYMHSSTNRTIQHGDVKPANILLTNKFIPKISDIGTSKLLTVDKDFTMFVVGSMGYIDPVFHKTGHLTQKSDVYSFGVVLLELISRKPTIYGENCSLIIEFQKSYDKENSGRMMFDKDIEIEEDILILEEIGRLAMECLKEKVEERPDMKEVAERLVMLRRSRKGGQGSYSISPQNFEEISIEGTPKSFGAEISESSNAAEERKMKKQTTNTVIVFPSRNKKQKRKEDGRRFSGDQTAASKLARRVPQYDSSIDGGGWQ